MFNKKLKPTFLGKKTNIENKETVASDSDDELKDDALSEKPHRSKNKLKLTVMITALFVLSAAGAYLYLDGILKEPLKPNLSSRLPAKTEMPVAQTPPPSPDSTSINNNLPLDAQQRNTQITVSSTPSGSRDGQSQMPAPLIPQRQPYIPAKDILAGTADLQAAKGKIEKLELDLKLKRLEKELTQVSSELSLVPIQTEAQKAEAATRIAEKKVRPVEVENQNAVLPPPSLVYTTGDTAALQMPTGQQLRVRVGNAVGDYIVTSIKSNIVVLTDKGGKQTEIAMQSPDNYPVHPSMFGNKLTGASVVSPPATVRQQDISPPFVQPQFVPIPVQRK
jgi:hypothetical protein